MIGSKCNGCYACANLCDCIEMKIDENGFWYPFKNDKCIQCGLCVRKCPALKKSDVRNNPVSYVAFNKDENIRINSASGGIFTAVAEKILDNNGIVFGAKFDEKLNVIHGFSDNKKDLEKFRGSKYVQSKIGDNFKKVKEFLLKGQDVLFTGTPCQIGGLYAYLGKNYDNLFTQDIICHGVPSPKVFKKYIDYMSKISKPLDVSFRNKNEGWRNFSMAINFENGVKYSKNYTEDLMLVAYVQNICLRMSCHNCAFKSRHRQSDLTIADYWGVENVHPHLDDDMGISVIIVNSKKGELLFEKIKENLIFQETNLDTCLIYNPSMEKSVVMDNNRSDFFKNLNNLDFNDLVQKYCNL